MRWQRYLGLIVLSTAAFAVGPVYGAQHGSHLAALVASQGLEAWNEAREDADDAPDSPLLADANGRRNLAETNLNWAAALLEAGERPDLAHQVIEAVLEHQDTAEGSSTRGLFRWFADPAKPYSADATLYLAPALAHLARTVEDAELQQTLADRAKMALQGLLAADRQQGGFGAAMWAGAVASLSDAAGEPAGAQAAAGAISGMYARLKREGLGTIHSPTFDALRIGGLRWALQFAADDAAREEARTALRLCYADILQRYDSSTAIVAGAIGTAYPADYLGDTGVAQYLLACDLPSALAETRSASPLAMYFALSDYALPPELMALAERDGGWTEVRTRTPATEDSEAVEASSTCTWVGNGMSLGTMSGPIAESTIPVLATCDLPERPTTYIYPFGGAATLQSAQSGGLALCSFNFDGVGVGGAIRVGVQGMLGRRDQIDRVLIGRHEWIGEPEAVGQNTVVAVRRGNSYVGMKILATGSGETSGSSIKPGAISWLREGNMDSLMLKVYGRRAPYPLQKPLYDVRVGLLVEVAPASQFESLEQFGEHVSARKVTQDTSEKKMRVDNVDESQQIPGRHEIKSIQEMTWLRFIYHEMMLKDETTPLGLTEELLRNYLTSRTLPEELPEDYLWASPALSLQRDGEPVIGPALPEAETAAN
jgi:hypothetical protein